MKKISDVNITMPVLAARSEVMLPVRTAALDRKDYDRIEYQIKKYFEVREIFDGASRYNEDLGRSDYQTWHKGWEVEPKGEIVPGGLVDAIRRPAGPQHIDVHLTRLSAHKRQTKGAKAQKIIIEDLAHDLDGVSEWAVVKACEDFRHDPSPFFPETPDILKRVKGWDELARKFGEPTPPEPPKTLQKDEWKPPTEEQKAAVREMLEKNGFGAHEEKVENNELLRPAEPKNRQDSAAERPSHTDCQGPDSFEVTGPGN